jgi:tetratricopeptide (TPR) repeat protein
VKRRLTLLGLLGLAAMLRAADAGELVREALAAEAQLDSRAALRLYAQADAARPNDAFILQKIARQYSDLVVEQPDSEAKKRYAQTALDYAQRAVALKPDDAVNVLSLAVCHGKLAVYSDTKTKIRYSRLVKEEAERALALDPNYAWAHHLLGRWHYEVADLGATSKFFVRLLYGGLPPASFAEGIRHLKRATELEPDELNHWLELGFAYAAAGQPDEARTQWTRGLAMPSRGKHDEPAKQRAREALTRSG